VYSANSSEYPVVGPVDNTTVVGASVSAEERLTIRVADTIQEVEEFRDVWSAWNSDRDTDIDFCLQHVWKSDEFIRPHVVVIFRNGSPVAMFLGRLEHSRIDLRIGYLKLLSMKVKLLAFASGGFLGNGSAENVDAFIRSAMNELRNGLADTVLLQQVRPGSEMYRSALGLPSFATRDYLSKTVAHHVMKLSDVNGSRSDSHWADFLRKRKKIRRGIIKDFNDSVKVERLCDAAELDYAIGQVEPIAARSYQRGLGVGFKDSPQMRDRLRLCAEKGWLRIYLLSLGGKPCAFWVGTVYNGTFTSDDIGFDTQFGKYSPGMFLLTEMIEDFSEEGVREIDFGLGGGLYKERFSNLQSEEAAVFFFAPTLKGLCVNAARTATGLLDNLIRRVLAQTSLLPKIKKIWRTRLAAQGAPKSEE
jgi:hypothetical protein